MKDVSWRTLGRTYLHRSPWFDFRLDRVLLPGGEEIDYGVLEGREVSVVVAETPEGNLLLVRQWRQPLGRFETSLPGGMAGNAESPAEAAKRELLEETGYRAEGCLKKLFSVHTSPGRSNEVFHIFRCRAVADEEGPGPDPTEYVEVLKVSPEKARRMIEAGEISDAATVLGLLRVFDS